MQTTNNLWPKVFSIGTVLVLLGGVVYWAVVYRTGSPEENRLREQERVAAIIQAGDPARCAEARGLVIGGVDYEVVCKNNIAQQKALSSLDLTACDNMDGVLFDKTTCKKDIIRLQLERTLEKSVCDRVADTDFQQFCLQSYWGKVAVLKRAPSICQNLTVDKLAADCEQGVFLTLLSQDINSVSCSTLSGVLRNDCLLIRKALTEKDTQQCKNIVLEPVRAVCLHQEP